MKKKILIVVLCLSIVSSIWVSIIRWRVEHDNRRVEMTCDYTELSQLSLRWGYDIDAFSRELKEAGISSITIEEETLETLSSEGRLTLITGEEIKRFQYLAPVQSIFLKDFSKQDIEKYSFVVTSDFALGEKIERILVEKLGEKKVNRMKSNHSGKPLLVLSVYGMEEGEICQLGIGFSNEKIERIANHGLKAILLLTNSPFISERSIKTLFSTVGDWGNISTVVFSGDSILGNPHFLDSVRKQLDMEGVKLGIVEFLNQDGLDEVTKNMYQKIVRVHSISTEEFVAINQGGGLNISTLIARFHRAVKERNVRLLYIRLPFLSGNSENLQVQSNLDYIRAVKAAMTGSNFEIGFSEPFKPLPASLNLLRLPIFLVILMLPLWLISMRSSVSLSFYYFYLFASLALILFFWQETLFVQIVALIAALSFPLLALIFGLLLPESSMFKTYKKGNILPAIWLFLKVTITTVFGGLVIACLVTRLDFMLKVHQFRGVKVSFILPLIMGLFLLSGWGEQSLKEKGLIRFYVGKVAEFLSRKVEFKHLLIISILVFGGIVLLLRSGNYRGPFLWEIENRVREILEKLLIVRPRIKEFFIGHPLMILGIFLYLKGGSRNLQVAQFEKKENLGLKSRSWQSFIILGLIGQVSVINSFCHAHTPLVISLTRTMNGIWLGIIIGVLLVSIVRRSTGKDSGIKR
jgi:hypothetical protein